MKRKFTFLIAAAFMLLTMVATTGEMWGQSDYSTDYTGNVTLSTSGGTSASTCKIKIGSPAVEYNGIKAGTSSVAGAVKITVPSGTKHLHLHLAAWNGENVTLSVTPSSYSSDISLTSNSGISGNSPFTFSGDPSTSSYYKVITFTNALTSNTDLTFAAKSGKRFVVWGVTAEEEGSSEPSCTVNPASWDFGSVQAGSSTQTKQFTVTTANLEHGLAVYLLDGTHYSTDVNGISSSATSTTVTITLNPTIVGTIADELVIEGDDFDDPITVDLTATGLCNAPADNLAFTTPVNIDFTDEPVEYTLNPIANTGNGGSITYELTTNPGDNGEITEGNKFYAIAVGQYVVHATQALNGTTCGDEFDITINVIGTSQHTITFNAGTGSCTIPSMAGIYGSSITLPEASTVTAPEGWTFAGWCATNVAQATTTQPTLLSGSYTITGDATLYAVYSKAEFNGDTQEFNFASIAAANNWSSGTAYTTVTLSPVTLTANGGGNNGKYYSSDNSWRIYNGGSISITTTTGNVTAVTSTPSKTFTINNGVASFSASATTQFTQINVTYGTTTTYYHTSPTPKVATPTIEVVGVSTGATNTYYETATVTLSCGTDGATIHYTTNGTEPTGESATYSAPFAVTESSNIKAIAIKDGYINSEIATQSINIVHRNATFTDGVYNTLTSSSEFNDWYAYSVEGAQLWYWYNNSSCARMSGYSSGNYANEDWLVSPKMLVENGKLNLTFSCAGAYGDENTLSVKYSTAYPGYGDPTNYMWSDVTTNPALPTTTGVNNFINITCNISDLPTNTNIFVAFKYTSTTTTAGTSHIKTFSAKQCYPVTYNSNGGTGTMTDVNSPYAVGTTVTTLENTFTAPDGKIFEKWSDGVNNYAEGATFTMPNNAVELTAQWISPCTIMATMGVSEAEYEYVNNTGNKSYKINLSSKVTVLGSCDITEYGFVYSTSETTPTIENATKLAVGSEYTTPNTIYNGEIENATGTYYVRAFATNAAGTAYSENTVTVVIPNTYPTWTVQYSVNGIIEDVLKEIIDRGDAASLWDADKLEEESIELPTNCSLAGWSSNESSTETVTSFVPEMDATLYAVLNYKGTYNLVTSVSQLSIGDHIVIAANGYDYAMSTDQNTNNRGRAAITKSGNTITWGNNAKVCEFVIGEGTQENTWSFYDGTNNGYIYAASSSANNMRTEEELSNNSSFTISISDGIATVTAQGTNTRNIIKYNDGSSIFSCYASGQKAISLYKKNSETYNEIISGDVVLTESTTITASTLILGSAVVDAGNYLTNDNPANLIVEDGGQLIVNNAGVQATYKKSVSHTAAKTDPAENWYTIASPVNNIAPGSVTNLIQATATNYDLYYYDEVNQMWKNHKANAFANLTNGKGYLYWNSTGAELAFPGELNNGNVNVDVTVTGTGGPAGFNLIGNPYSHNIYKGNAGCAILNSQSKAQLAAGFYRLSNGGSWDATLDIITDGTAIKPGEGILVKATTAGVVTITNTASAPSSKANNEFIKFMVNNSQYEDAAYALLSDEAGLDKIDHRNANIPMIYIPQDGQNYAIATMNDNTEMFGLNVKAMTTGKYTLKTKANGDFSYLHIIDRLTGDDVDMLLEGEYSFIASPQDTDARFIVKLRYNANGNITSGDIFAYQNGSDIVVNGEGELQVFDVMGRLIATQHINGVQTVNVNANGVYIFKLNEKAQKIVVR